MQESYLKLSVLNILSRQELSGYKLMKEIAVAVGKKPSPGSIYPLLKNLQKQKYITNTTKNRSKIYSLTSQGKTHLKHLLNHGQETLVHMEQAYRYFEHICNEKHPSMKHAVTRLLQGKLPLGSITSDALHLRTLLFRVYDQGLNEKQLSSLKHLLQQTSKEIEHLCKKS